VLAHDRRLLTGTPAGATQLIDADLLDPERVLTLAGRDTLDLTRPVGLILMNVLGHVSDLDAAGDLARRLLAGLPSGSYLVTADGTIVWSPSVQEWSWSPPRVTRVVRCTERLGGPSPPLIRAKSTSAACAPSSVAS
jgi:hypothetical protein